MHVIVAGGAGFIGSNLTRRLLSEGHRVTIIDDLTTGFTSNVPDGAMLVRHDISQMKAIPVDRAQLIFNLACPASPVAYQRDPIKTLDTCYLGTRTLLDMAWEMGAKLLHASTSEVYGDPLQHPQQEEHWGNVNPIGPRSCYDEGKRVAETLCFEGHRAGQPVSMVRIFNTYGPFMAADDGRVISNFITQVQRANPITVYGDGSQTRSFCFVDDTVEALVKVAMDDECPFGPFNVGNPNEITVLELAHIVSELMDGSKPNVLPAPLPKDDPVRRRPDIGRIVKRYEWFPRVALRDGLKRTIDYFANLKAVS